MIKVTIKIIGIILFIIFISIIIFFSINVRFIKSDKKYVNYLINNKVNVPSSEGIIKDTINLNIENADVFLLGENHGIKDIQRLDDQLFLYLNKKYGVKYYVAEINEKLAVQLNEYISKEDEDSLLLKSIVEKLSDYIPQQSSIEYYEKWKNIRKFNLSNHKEDRIKVIGIDIPNPYMEENRDSLFYENFIKFYDTINNKEKTKFYGLLGHMHILQEKISNNTRPFANRLKERKIKVVSIASYSIDSYIYLPDSDEYPKVPGNKSKWFNLNGPLFYLYGVNDLLKSSKNETLTLFKLNNKNTPYLFDTKLVDIKNLIGKDIKPDNSKENTINFIQYVFLIKKSEASTPMVKD